MYHDIDDNEIIRRCFLAKELYPCFTLTSLHTGSCNLGPLINLMVLGGERYMSYGHT